MQNTFFDNNEIQVEFNNKKIQITKNSKVFKNQTIYY